jgi:hypothetical protein
LGKDLRLSPSESETLSFSQLVEGEQDHLFDHSMVRPGGICRELQVLLCVCGASQTSGLMLRAEWSFLCCWFLRSDLVKSFSI